MSGEHGYVSPWGLQNASVEGIIQPTLPVSICTNPPEPVKVHVEQPPRRPRKDKPPPAGPCAITVAINEAARRAEESGHHALAEAFAAMVEHGVMEVRGIEVWR